MPTPKCIYLGVKISENKKVRILEIANKKHIPVKQMALDDTNYYLNCNKLEGNVINPNGIVYILTNESFPNYVKFGFTTDINEMLKNVNKNECLPFDFKIYATCDVNSALTDEIIHNFVNDPDVRIREFYDMPRDKAYSILKKIAKKYKCEHTLKTF